MDRRLLRLELLKLTFKAAPTGRAEQAVSDARMLEEYCLAPVEETLSKPVPEEPPMNKEPVKLSQQQSHKKGNGR